MTHIPYYRGNWNRKCRRIKTPKYVRRAKELYAIGFTQREIGIIFKCSEGTICRWLKEKT